MESRVGSSINAVETLNSRHPGIVREGIQGCTRNMVMDPIDRARVSNTRIGLQVAHRDSAHWPCPCLCVLAVGPKFPFPGIRMIKMNRNNEGPLRWDGRSSLRDAAPCNQPGNRHLWPDDGNRGIDGNTGGV